MKFTWGHGILIAIILIIVTFTTALILSFNRQVTLVTEDYYAKELAYQDEIENISRATAKHVEVAWEVIPDKFLLRFSSDLPPEECTGEVFFYRSSDSSLDFTTELNLDTNGIQQFDKSFFSKGKYQVQISFTYDNSNYYIEKHIFIP